MSLLAPLRWTQNWCLVIAWRRTPLGMECPAEDALHEKRNWKTDWVQPTGPRSQDLGAKAKSLEVASEALAGEY